MSASVYNNPYVYKEPFPKIEYPRLFSAKVSFKHIFDSLFLVIASILFGVAFCLLLICVFVPFWFKLVFSAEEGTYGTEAVKLELSINTGLFFLNEDEMDNLVDLNKHSNQDNVPKVLVLAQILCVTGMCTLVACLAGCVILMFRRFASATANFIISFFSSFAGICFILTIVFALITSQMSSCDPYDTNSSCKYKDNLKWRLLPIYSQRDRVEPLVTPYIKLNWAFYIFILPALLTIAGSVMLWLEAFATYRKLNEIRYTQLRTARDPHEGDINPSDHGKYVYRAPVKTTPLDYEMQPVIFQGGSYGPQQPSFAPMEHPPVFDDYQPKKTSFSPSPPTGRRSPTGFRRRSPSPTSPPSPSSGRRSSPPPRRRSPPPNYRRRSPSPPPSRRGGGPPSINSSMSEGPYISREIDL